VKSTIKLINNIKKKNNNNKISVKPKKFTVDTSGNKYINSISYKRKNIQINKKGMGNLIGFCVTGLKPHS